MLIRHSITIGNADQELHIAAEPSLICQNPAAGAQEDAAQIDSRGLETVAHAAF
jgi:hypothetical protein